MARPKKRNPVLEAVRSYVDSTAPELRGAAIDLHMLDGPAGSPRFAASAEACMAAMCPYGVPRAVADAGECPVHECGLRRSLRLLLDRSGTVLRETRSCIHWRGGPPVNGGVDE